MTDNLPGPSALIVIPTLNEADYIGSLLDQIMQSLGAGTALVVVADGGSVDDTCEIVKAMMERYSNLRLAHNAKRLQSAAVNLVASQYSGEYTYLIRIDAHAGYPDDFVRNLLRAASASGAQSVVVPMVTEGSDCFQRGVAAAQNSRLGTGGAAHRHAGKGQWVDHGHHALFDLAWFQKLGGYDEKFSHNEDAEYDFRLIKSGGRIWLDGANAIRYFPRKDGISLFRQYFNYGKGRSRTIKKHKVPLKLRQVLPIFVAPVCVLSLFSPFSAIFCVPFLVWAAASLGYGAFLAAKQRSGCVFSAGPAAMIMHLAWSCGFIMMTISAS